MAPSRIRAAAPMIKLDDSDDDAEIDAARDRGARSPPLPSAPNDAAPPLFVLTTEQSYTTSFPVGCPVLYGFASDPSAVHACEGIVKEVAMRVDRRLEYRIEPRREIERRMWDGGGGGEPVLDRAMEDQIAYAIRCDVLVASEDGAREGEGEPAEVLFVKSVSENGRASMRYTVQYAAAKENYTLRMSEGLRAERLSFNRHYDYAANNEVGESGGDEGGGRVPQEGEEQRDHPPPAVVPAISNSESWSLNANPSTEKCSGEPSKGQKRAVEDLPPAMGGGGPLRGGADENIHNPQEQLSPRSNDAGENVHNPQEHLPPRSNDAEARPRTEDLSTVEDEPRVYAAAEEKADASYRQPLLCSITHAEGGAGDASTLTCDLSDHSGGMSSPDRRNGSSRRPAAARAGGTRDPASPAAVPAQHRKINFEAPARKRSAASMTPADTVDLPASSALETIPRKRKLPRTVTTMEGDASGPTKEMTRRVRIPKDQTGCNYVGLLVGRGGSKIRELEASAGGNVKISFSGGKQPRHVLLKGQMDNVAKAETLVRELLTPIIPDGVSMPPSIPAGAVSTVCNELRPLDPKWRQEAIDRFNRKMSSSKTVRKPVGVLIGIIRKCVDAQTRALAKTSVSVPVAAPAEHSMTSLLGRPLSEKPREGFLCRLTVPLWLNYNKDDLFRHILGVENKSSRRCKTKKERLGHKTRMINTETGCSVGLSSCDPRNGIPLVITIDSRGHVRSKMARALTMVEESIFDFHQEGDADGRLRFEMRKEAEGNFLAPPAESGAVRMDQHRWVQLLELSHAKTGGIIILDGEMQLRSDLRARMSEETECSAEVFPGSPDAQLRLCKPYILICGRKLGQVDMATAMISDTWHTSEDKRSPKRLK